MDEVRFCENNFQYDIEDITGRIEKEFEDVKVEVESCLGHCDICAEGPFALVNEEVIQADNAEDLYEKIKDSLGF